MNTDTTALSSAFAQMTPVEWMVLRAISPSPFTDLADSPLIADVNKRMGVAGDTIDRIVAKFVDQGILAVSQNSDVERIGLNGLRRADNRYSVPHRVSDAMNEFMRANPERDEWAVAELTAAQPGERDVVE